MWRSHIGTNGLISFLPHFSLPCSSHSPSIPLHSPYLSCPLTLETVLAPPPGGGREWVLVGVAGSSHLGSKERIREKLLNLQGSVLREVEAGQKAIQEVHSQQARVQDAEARCKEQLVLRVYLLRLGRKVAVTAKEEEQLKDLIDIANKVIIEQRKLNISSHISRKRKHSSAKFDPVPTHICGC